MKHNHFEVIRKRLLADLDYSRMFAIWRVDPPWQPCTKRVKSLFLSDNVSVIT